MPHSAPDPLGVFVVRAAGALRLEFFSATSSFSVQSVGCALVIAVVFLAVQRRLRGKRVRIRTLVRGLLPTRLIRSASARADIAFFLFNSLAAGALFGWALLSSHAIALFVHARLEALLGAYQGPGLAPWLAASIMTLGVFLAYEFGYWIDHFLKHKISFLWAFHRVHHTAQSLSPLTNFRVHPVDSIVFLNILALATGAASGVLSYTLGPSVRPFTLGGGNAILIVGLYLSVHLQHSQVWIPARGFLGRIVVSPAHHQLHHSADPAHFNRNFGGYLSIFDWAFGTLLIPDARPPRLVFGVEPRGENPHSVLGAAVAPFLTAASPALSWMLKLFQTWRRQPKYIRSTFSRR